jgi:hypothetical protein
MKSVGLTRMKVRVTATADLGSQIGYGTPKLSIAIARSTRPSERWLDRLAILVAPFA